MGFKRFWLTLIIILLLATPSYSADIRTGGGHIIEDEGGALTQRPTLNITGDGAACTDDAANNETDCAFILTPLNSANYYLAGANYDIELWDIPTIQTSGNCKISTCVEFNGTSEYGTINGLTALSGGYSTLSFEGWFYLNSVAPIQQVLDVRNADNTSVFAMNISGAKPKIFIKLNGTTLIDFYTTSDVISINTWYHIEWVYDNAQSCPDKVKIYLNGVSQTLTQITCVGGTVPVISVYPPQIGRYFTNGGSGQYYNGRMDTIALWNTAHSQSGVDGRYNSGSGVSITGSETNLLYGWNMNDGGMVQPQSKTYTTGDNNNTCTSSGSPCRTLTGLLAKISKRLSQDAIIHVASGLNYYAGVEIVSGFSGYGLTIQGYNNPTINSFSNSPIITGTSSGSNTSNFPASTFTLFNDTANKFVIADAFNKYFLKLTGGTGYNSSDDSANWYVIYDTVSASQVQIVGRWRGSTPDNTTTYAVYSPWGMSAFNGQNGYARAAFDIRDSLQISINNIRISSSSHAGLFIKNTSMENIKLLYLDHNGYGSGNYWQYGAAGLHSVNSNINTIDTVIGHANYTQNFNFINFSAVFELRYSLAESAAIDAGFLCRDHCVITTLTDSLAASNTFAGFDYEYFGITHIFERNRSSSNAKGLVINDHATVNDDEYNYFQSNTGDGIFVANNGTFGCADGDACSVTHSDNNGGYGLTCTSNSQYDSGVTFTSNTSGTTNVLGGCVAQ